MLSSKFSGDGWTRGLSTKDECGNGQADELGISAREEGNWVFCSEELRSIAVILEAPQSVVKVGTCNSPEIEGSSNLEESLTWAALPQLATWKRSDENEADLLFPRKVVMEGVIFTASKRLDRRFFLLRLFCRRKYFWAWLATWVGVLVVTKFREMPRQSPFPRFSSPARNDLCSSSLHGTPKDHRAN